MKITVLVTVGFWIVMVVLVISICRAAKCGDEAMDAVSAQALMESPSTDQTLRTLDPSHAATLLGVSPETLLAWEARYGFPTSSTLDGRYNQWEVLALRDGIANGASIAAAIASARQRNKRRPTASRAWAAEHRDGGLAS